MKTTTTSIIFAFLITVLTCSAQTAAPPATASPTPPEKPHQAGKPAPDLSYLNLTDGTKASLTTTHRGKIVVLEFWATWCGPCEPAMAGFQKLAAKFADKKDRIEFLTISIDGAERETKNPAPTNEVRDHLKRKGWTQAINGWSTFEERKVWGLHFVPITFIIGPDGKFIGDPSQDVEKVITELLTK